MSSLVVIVILLLLIADRAAYIIAAFTPGVEYATDGWFASLIGGVAMLVLRRLIVAKKSDD